MKKSNLLTISFVLMISLIISCSKTDLALPTLNSTVATAPKVVVSPTPMSVIDPYAAIKLSFGTNIDPLNLLNYANQAVPNYINKDNTGNNIITRV